MNYMRIECPNLKLVIKSKDENQEVQKMFFDYIKNVDITPKSNSNTNGYNIDKKEAHKLYKKSFTGKKKYERYNYDGSYCKKILGR